MRRIITKIVPVVLSQTQSSRPSVLGTEPKSEINALWLLLLSDAGNPAGAPSAHGARGQERSAKVYPTAKVYPREVWSLGLQCQETCLSYSAVLVASPRIHQQQHQHRQQQQEGGGGGGGAAPLTSTPLHSIASTTSLLSYCILHATCYCYCYYYCYYC